MSPGGSIVPGDGSRGRSQGDNARPLAAPLARDEDGTLQSPVGSREGFSVAVTVGGLSNTRSEDITRHMVVMRNRQGLYVPVKRPARSLEMDRRGSLGDLVSFGQEATKRDEYDRWRQSYPCALGAFQGRLAERLRGKRIVLFTDYDGTLANIVREPENAFMSDHMRRALNLVSQLFPTAIVSGRARRKVEDFVGLDHLMYAGSHGLDIAAPTLDVTNGKRATRILSHTPGERFGPLMDKIFASLSAAVKDIKGSGVEHNKFAVSVHFRNCSPADYQRIQDVVEAELACHDGLRMSRGRKVLEVRPELQWDKGKALTYLMRLMGLDRDPHAVPIYLGDDRTDEDAFRAVTELSQDGFGVLVSTIAKDTGAKLSLRDPAEVERFLRLLAQWGMDGERNPWLTGEGLSISLSRVAEVTAETVDAVDHIPESEEIPPPIVGCDANVRTSEAGAAGPSGQGCDADKVVLWRPGPREPTKELARLVEADWRAQEEADDDLRTSKETAGVSSGRDSGAIHRSAGQPAVKALSSELYQLTVGGAPGTAGTVATAGDTEEGGLERQGSGLERRGSGQFRLSCTGRRSFAQEFPAGGHSSSAREDPTTPGSGLRRSSMTLGRRRDLEQHGPQI